MLLPLNQLSDVVESEAAAGVLYKPSGMTKTFSAVHKEWFDDFYKKGIAHTRDKLATYADQLINGGSFGDLPEESQRNVEALKANPAADNFCASIYAYPL